MHTIVFDVSGPYGHFRKPYAPASPVTYPFPPPPTVLGLMGAIVGYGKEEYLSKIGWKNVRVSIRLLRSTRKYRTGLNLRLEPDPRKKDSSLRGQYPYEFLIDPAFRIYIAEATDEAMKDLESQLRAGRTAIHHLLALAQMYRKCFFVGTFEAQYFADGVNMAFYCTDPEKCRYEPGRCYVRYRVPAQMQPIEQL